MLHPIEIFDNELLKTMATSLEAALQTLRLTGREPQADMRIVLARRIIEGASFGTLTPLSLAETALEGPWDLQEISDSERRT
jgi:hypothetical protein